MAFEVGRCCGGECALFATERFFSGVNQLVALEMSSSCGGVIALCASKRPLTTMNQHMAFQSSKSITCVVALVATKGLFLIILQSLLWVFCKLVCLHFPVLCSVMQGWRMTDDKKQQNKEILGKWKLKKVRAIWGQYNSQKRDPQWSQIIQSSTKRTDWTGDICFRF